MYEPPDDILDTREARGSYQLHQFYRELGVDMREFQPSAPKPPERGYYLFCGHRGCGKSTELRRIRNELHAPDAYYVVFADAAQELDVNNLRYQDILLHLAGKLVRQLEEDDISLDHAHLQKLEAWFSERVESQESTKEFAQHIRAGAGVDAGTPFHRQAVRRNQQRHSTRIPPTSRN